MPPTRSASSFFVALLLVLVAALSVAASARATGQLARGGARVQGYYLEDELRPLRSSRKLLQDAVPEAPAPVDEQVEDQESTPSSTTLEDAAEAVGDPGGVNEADEDGLSSDEPTTDQSQDTSPVTVVQESFSAPAPTGNDNEEEETSTSTATTTTSDSLSGLATSIAEGVNSASSEEEEEGSAPSSNPATGTDSLSDLAIGTKDDVASAFEDEEEEEGSAPTTTTTTITDDANNASVEEEEQDESEPTTTSPESDPDPLATETPAPQTTQEDCDSILSGSTLVGNACECPDGEAELGTLGCVSREEFLELLGAALRANDEAKRAAQEEEEGSESTTTTTTSTTGIADDVLSDPEEVEEGEEEGSASTTDSRVIILGTAPPTPPVSQPPAPGCDCNFDIASGECLTSDGVAVPGNLVRKDGGLCRLEGKLVSWPKIVYELDAPCSGSKFVVEPNPCTDDFSEVLDPTFASLPEDAVATSIVDAIDKYIDEVVTSLRTEGKEELSQELADALRAQYPNRPEGLFDEQDQCDCDITKGCDFGGGCAPTTGKCIAPDGSTVGGEIVTTSGFDRLDALRECISAETSEDCFVPCINTFGPCSETCSEIVDTCTVSVGPTFGRFDVCCSESVFLPDAPCSGKKVVANFCGCGPTLDKKIEIFELRPPPPPPPRSAPSTLSFAAARQSNRLTQGRTSSGRFGEGGGTGDLERRAAVAATARQDLVDDFATTISELGCVGADANATEPCLEEDPIDIIGGQNPIDIIRGRISG